MSMATGSKVHFEPGSWLEAVHDVYIGIVVGAAHSSYLIYSWWYDHLVVPLAAVFGWQLEQDDSGEAESSGGRNNDHTQYNNSTTADGRPRNELKVIAVGYGRTGTYSLTLALEELGYPTLHTQHLYEHASIQQMWADKVFLPSIEAGHATLGQPDLQFIADFGYQATADLPMALYFDQVLEQYPDCQFVLTTRENSDVWFRSWDTLTKSITNPTAAGGLFFNGVAQYVIYFRWLFSIVNQDDVYLQHPFPLPPQSKDAAIASYERHNERVRATIPADQLLEYNVKQGWEPLCQFLNGVDDTSCPTTPFPKTNSARSVQVQAVAAFVVPLAVVLVIVFTTFAIVFRRYTGQTCIQWFQYKMCALKVVLRRVFLEGGAGKVAWFNGRTATPRTAGRRDRKGSEVLVDSESDGEDPSIQRQLLHKRSHPNINSCANDRSSSPIDVY